MKTIGLIGGMSWESSAVYYQLINQMIKEKCGSTHSAQSLMYSVDFDIIAKLQHAGNWEELTKIMIDAAQKLEKGGADFILICTNTMHKMADEMAQNISIPILDIVDATASKIKEKNLKKVGLLGTNFTMSQDFYRKRLEVQHKLNVIIPNEEDREIIHRIIYQELILGQINEKSKKQYLKIIKELQKNGAEGIILGCTEIPLLIKQKEVPIPIFDTTQIHAEKAVEYALLSKSISN